MKLKKDSNKKGSRHGEKKNTIANRLQIFRTRVPWIRVPSKIYRVGWYGG